MCVCTTSHRHGGQRENLRRGRCQKLNKGEPTPARKDEEELKSKAHLFVRQQRDMYTLLFPCFSLPVVSRAIRHTHLCCFSQRAAACHSLHRSASMYLCLANVGYNPRIHEVLLCWLPAPGKVAPRMIPSRFIIIRLLV